MYTRIAKICLLSLLLAFVAGCGSYPYYGSDGVYYGKDYYDSYRYSYGSSYGYYDPYAFYPRSYYPYNYYYYRNSYFYNPYYPYYGYRRGVHDWGDDDREEHDDQSARDELHRITPNPRIRRPELSGDPPIIRRARQERSPVTVERGSIRRELNRINRGNRPSATRPITRTPRPQPSRSGNSARSELRSIEPPRRKR